MFLAHIYLCQENLLPFLKNSIGKVVESSAVGLFSVFDHFVWLTRKGLIAIIPKILMG